jgi:hypothetical protein
MTATKRLIAASLIAVALAGCRSTGDIVVDEGVGITAARSLCPAVGIPDFTGDVTLFSTPGSTDSRAIDVTAAMTNVRTQCNDTGEKIYATATFDVLGSRLDARGARQVQLPYFVSVLRGGRVVVSKRVGTVTLNFADGQPRAQASAQVASYIDRAEATLPADIREQLTRRRKAGEADAAVDPLTRPEVKAAVARATFEMLVGFQLTEAQLAYNATR